MGVYDIPATLSKIQLTRETELRKLGNEYRESFMKSNSKISYIGHSQGSAQLFAALTLNIEYYKKVLNGMIALGPVTRIKDISSSIVKFIAEYSLDKIFNLLGIQEVFNSKQEINQFTKIVCDKFKYICNEALEIVSDRNVKNNDPDKFLVFASHFPSGTSSKNIIHFAKIIRDKKFEDFDGRQYNLRLIIDFKIGLFVGKDDKLSSIEDSRILRKQLLESNSISFYKEYTNTGHATFFLNKDLEYIHDLLNCLVHFIS